jgi:hypothetical protein
LGGCKHLLQKIFEEQVDGGFPEGKIENTWKLARPDRQAERTHVEMQIAKCKMAYGQWLAP